MAYYYSLRCFNGVFSNWKHCIYKLCLCLRNITDSHNITVKSECEWQGWWFPTTQIQKHVVRCAGMNEF